MYIYPDIQQFDEISEILARYKTLHATMEDLMEQDQVNQDAIDREKAGMVQVVEVRTTWQCNTQVRTLQCAVIAFCFPILAKEQRDSNL
jgi:hypothetical protein